MDSKRRILTADERTRALLEFGFDSRLLPVLNNPGKDAVASKIWYGPCEQAMSELLAATGPLYWDLLPEGEIAPVVQLDDSSVYFVLLVRPRSGSAYLMLWQEEFADQLACGVVRFLVDSLDSLCDRDLERDTIRRWARRIGCDFADAFLAERHALDGQPPSKAQHDALVADFVARHSGQP